MAGPLALRPWAWLPLPWRALPVLTLARRPLAGLPLTGGPLPLLPGLLGLPGLDGRCGLRGRFAGEQGDFLSSHLFERLGEHGPLGRPGGRFRLGG